MSRIAVSAVVVALLAASSRADDSANRPAEYDRFNYDTTVRENDHNDYGPEDWIRVRCPDTQTCLGWPDSFDEAIGWSFPENSCQWCPAGRGGCPTHHQSPINVYRDVQIEGDPLYNPCIDGHWMKFFDSTCSLEELQRNNAFSIERHALKIAQPTEQLADGSYRIGCQNELGRRWGKIDFAKGFSAWWHLSHTDLHVPSEHTQNGKRYDGEIQLYHFYSISGEEAGVNNEMGTVTFFLQVYDDAPDYDMLNRVICQWRRAEDQTRAACGLPSVETEYPGCHSYSRGHTASTTAGRKLRTPEFNTTLPPKPMSAHDIIIHNYLNQGADRKTITMDEEDYRDEDDFDWPAFIAAQYENERQVQNRRHLTNYDHVGPWHNYWPLIGVKTEYYYRYSGSQTIPPCYGRFVEGNNRAQTNNWRVMKDPIRISKRQLDELHRLLRERIAPPDDPLVACQADTAAKVDPTTNFVDVARPLQQVEKAHHMVYCECENWGSQWEEDKDYCRIFRDDRNARYFQHPYNFYTEGF